MKPSQADLEHLLMTEDYSALVDAYELLIEQEPTHIDYYFSLGLVYLLQKQEELAQLTWFVAFSEISAHETDRVPDTFVKLLDQEADRQESLEKDEIAWLIRAHLRGYDAYNIDNLLHLLCLDIKLNTFTQNRFSEWDIISVLNQELSDFSETWLLETLRIMLDFPTANSVDFAEAALKLTHASEQCELTIIETASRFCYDQNYYDYAIELAQACLRFNPTKLTLLKQLIWFFLHKSDYNSALEAIDLFLNNSQTLSEKIFGEFYRLRAKLALSDWVSVPTLIHDYLLLLGEFSHRADLNISSILLLESSLISFSQPLSYIQDKPTINRFFTNKIGQIFQRKFQEQNKNNSSVYLNSLSLDRPLRIGYVSYTFHNHSVSWLCRWLLKHHDRNQFLIYIYSLKSQSIPGDYLRAWFQENSITIQDLGRNKNLVMKQIKDDEIDILVDLDSFTINTSCEIFALKPAPVQVTWLGNDASGIPAIDYFIADPYVLPDNAESYYSEKIWRLPYTYLGIDGFEFGVPTLRRENINIPDNAVIYMNFQNASKRHPDTIRLQYKILNAVPNSYFLIKGTGDPDITQQFYRQLAIEEGFPLERIRFIERDKTEFEHRANLKNLADIVLDTYPYNGATTTLETLWCEIPLVTRVGEQFAARNSYTFMINAGITEGIAWTDEEYVEWGIKLGTDENLRKKISWKLKQAKKTSPLWNGKQFARDMENAYRQMWEIHVEKTLKL